MTESGYDTRTALIESGKAEFLKYGFEKASLRKICANANVTTGAFYANFKAKKELFAAVVDDDLQACEKSYGELTNTLADMFLQGDDGESRIMSFAMEHRDLFKLLIDCSEGSQYEGFKDLLVSTFDDVYRQLFEQGSSGQVDEDLVHVIVCMKFAQCHELLYGNYDRDSVTRMTDQLARSTKAGIAALLNDEPQ